MYDDTGEKIIHSTPAILEPIEFVPGHEPVIVEKPNMGRRISTAHKNQPPPIAKPVMPPIDEATGEPMKLMKVPGCWTPANRRGNAAFIYIFFRNVCEFFTLPFFTLKYLFQYTEHFLPPDPEMIPQHLLFVFDAYKRQNIFDACKPDDADVLSFGYFSSEDLSTCTLLAKTTDKYELLKPTV